MKICVIYFISLIILGCVAAPITHSKELQTRKLFDMFKREHNKIYKSLQEEELRFNNFVNTLSRISKLNKGDKHATYAVNQFSDLSQEEFRSTRLSQKVFSPQALARSCLANGVTALKISTVDLPTAFDWRNESKVTPIKDQGQCGSCWAFSTIGNIESQWAIKGNPLTSFSEQLLVDCSTGCCMEEGEQVCNSGCGGGWQWNAYQDILSWGGVETEVDYPYVAVDQVCKLDKKKVHAPISNYTCLSNPNPADEDQMQSYLVNHGPLAIALNAGYLQDYYGGIIDPWFGWECDGTQLDHALLIVGYGVASDGTVYWIVKNSWGVSWGENGYFRIAKGYGVCGLNNAVSSVIM